MATRNGGHSSPGPEGGTNMGLEGRTSMGSQYFRRSLLGPNKKQAHEWSQAVTVWDNQLPPHWSSLLRERLVYR